ncbi:MAG: SDR family oxidoreductase [Bacteroidales bacterium]|jgi:NAD(P)H dehydrogenase (quinone)|nr:SDR family oxidoreductase [Bacteroidales bacterium]
MIVAVTAANGHLGSAIIKQLITDTKPENIVGIARTPQKAEFLGIEIRKGDYNNRGDFDAALKGIDALLIVSSMDEPQKRIQQHRNIIDGAKASGVKKIVYTSIVGDSEKNAFSPIVRSNRQTEEDVQNSGLNWVIGRNGIYIEPDLEYIDNYKARGEIYNSAAGGKCAYTSRAELAVAYSKMLLEDKHVGKIYNLVGEPVTQKQLAGYLNQVYGTSLVYRSASVEDYLNERKAELGEFLGTIISGIYEGIRNDAYNVVSDFGRAAGRTHKPALQIIKDFNESL